MRVPIRIKQAPRFIREVAERSQVLRRPAPRRARFQLCFFTCRSYFAYLYCSLHSLKASLGDTRYSVLVFSDTDQPLSAAQVEAVQALVPDSRVIPWPKSMGRGADQIGNIWRAYALAADEVEDDDFVVRVDSDVFFFNARIFDAVQRCDADLIGDGHFIDFEYCQGGVYFVRASAVRRVVGFLAEHDLATVLAESGINVEDAAIYHFALRLGLRVWMTWFMMFPDELRNAGSLNAWQRWKFSCLHFVMKNKVAMIEAYRRELLLPGQAASFERAIGIA
jgi:hypothetical protein